MGSETEGRVKILTTKRTASGRPQSETTLDNELFGQLAAATAELKVIDEQLAVAGEERDLIATHLELAQLPNSGVSSLGVWRLEEELEKAKEVVSHILKGRASVARTVNRLNGYAEPLVKAARELEQRRRALAAWQKIAEALPLLAQLDEIADEAKSLGYDTGYAFTMPSSLTRTLRGSWRAQLAHGVQGGVEGNTNHIARLEAGLS
jgi:hypothetical protein